MKSSVFALAISLVSITTSAFGGISAPGSLVGLTTSSDLIVSGSISGVAQSGSAAVITLTVSRVVKGNPIAGGSSISVSWQLGAARLAPGTGHVDLSLPANPNGLWFLRDSTAGWSLAPVWQGDVPLSSTFIPQPPGPLPSAYSYTSDAALTDKVAAEVSFGIENGANGDLQLEQVELGLLDALSSPYIQTLYQRLSVSPSVPQQIQGLAGSIRAGSAAALSAAANSATAFVSYPVENGLLLLSISSGFRAADPAPVAVLGQITLSSAVPQPFREACAHALASIHTAATLPFLATLLDDADEMVRVESVGGFSAFANGLPIQTSASNASLAHLQLPPSGPYKTSETVANFAMGQQAVSSNEAKYLSFWKSWWAQRGATIGQ